MKKPIAKLFISADGSTIQGVYTDAFNFQGVCGPDKSIRRASHVEPTSDGQWTADMSPSLGPVLGPFPTRGEALAQEKAWLERELSVRVV